MPTGYVLKMQDLADIRGGALGKLFWNSLVRSVGFARTLHLKRADLDSRLCPSSYFSEFCFAHKDLAGIDRS